LIWTGKLRASQMSARRVRITEEAIKEFLEEQSWEVGPPVRSNAQLNAALGRPRAAK